VTRPTPSVAPVKQITKGSGAEDLRVGDSIGGFVLFAGMIALW